MFYGNTISGLMIMFTIGFVCGMAAMVMLAFTLKKEVEEKKRIARKDSLKP